MTELRPYQANAIQEARRRVSAGARRPLLVSPTGSGKTRIASEIAHSHVGRGGRVLWLAHRAELVEQAADALVALGCRVGVVGDSVVRARDAEAPIQVAMLQTLLARPHVRPTATMVVADEAHHLAAPEWSAVVNHYETQLRIGLTATPERSDGKGLRGVFDTIVPVASIRELTALGHLVPCAVDAPARTLKSGTIARDPLDAYRAHCQGRRTLLFAANVLSAEEYRESFTNAGIACAVVTGETPWQERRQVVADFRAGRLDVLINVYVLTEGFDAPETSACILARGCGSPGMYLQIVGRILRPAAGKTDAVLVDLRGVVHVHGAPDADREYSLDGAGIREKDALRFCQVCGAAMDPSDTTCAQCGWEPSGNGVQLPTVVNEALVRYASKRAEGLEDRARTLARWLKDGAAKGYKPGWALAKFRAVYGVWPSRDVQAKATEGEAA